MLRKCIVLAVILTMIFSLSACGLIPTKTPPTPALPEGVPTEPGTPSPTPEKANPEDIEWLAKVIASEAGSVYDNGNWVRCADEARAAVGWTVLNRLEAGTFGKTIKEVITAPGQYAYNQGSTSEITELAQKLLEGKIPDPTDGATHFFSPISMPKEGESTTGFDAGGGLHEVPGIAKKVYFPSWTQTLIWVGDLKNVTIAYFMFYRPGPAPIPIPETAIFVPDNYATIQQAVDAASPGDTIAVRDGTYTENVKVNKEHLTIRSENGADSTIVEAANSSDDVFEIMADYVTISGFTVKGATDVFEAGINIHKKASHCRISNNICSGNSNGIIVRYAEENVISHNMCCSNYNKGIWLVTVSRNNTISNNDCSKSIYGIFVESSNNNTISGNKCSNCEISLRDSIGNKLTENVIVGGGIRIWGDSLNDYANEIDTSNTVNGKPVQYWNGIDGGRIPDGAGQVILVNCKNVIIENQNLKNTGYAINVSFSSHISIRNNTCLDNSYGVFLGGSDNNNLFNNEFSNNRHGISLCDSKNNNVFRNICSDNKWGIELSWDADNNSFYLNNFIGNSENVDDTYLFHTSSVIWKSQEKITYIYKGKTHTNYLGNYFGYCGEDIDDDGVEDTGTYRLTEPFQQYEIK